MAPPRSGLCLHDIDPALDPVVVFLGIGCALSGDRVMPVTPTGRAPDREHDDEGRPTTGGLLDRHLASVGLDDRLHDGEAEAVAATLAAAAGPVGAVEALEDALPVRFWDAHAVVAHVEGDVGDVDAAD